MAAKIKTSKRIWTFFVPFLLLSLLFLYIRNKIGKLHCSSQESLTTFSQSLLRFFHRMLGFDSPVNHALHYRSQLCDSNILTICFYIIALNIPEDVSYWVSEVTRESELKEFIIRLSVVTVIVMCVILCNLYKWRGLVDDDDDDVVDVARTTATYDEGVREGRELRWRRERGGASVWTLWRVVGLVVILMTLVSIPWEFVRLYQREVSIRAAKTTAGKPQECFPQGMGIMQSLREWSKHHFSWSDDDPCNKYYYYLLVDPLWELTPLLVLSSAASRCVLHPVEQLFSCLGRSVRMFFQEIPAQWQPVVMAMTLVVILVSLLLKFRYRFSIPLLLKLEPKSPVECRQAHSRRTDLRNAENSYIDCYVDGTQKYRAGNMLTRQPITRSRRKKMGRD